MKPKTGAGLKQAKKLSRAEETKLRHDALTKPLAERKKILAELNQIPNGYADYNALAASVDAQPPVQEPWYMSDEKISALMKSAKNAEDFKLRLGGMLAAARHEAVGKSTDERHEQVKTNDKAWGIAIVCALIAKCETLEKVHRSIPKTVIVDGLTLARVVDALRDAGYTSEGKTGPMQWRQAKR